MDTSLTHKVQTLKKQYERERNRLVQSNMRLVMPPIAQGYRDN